MRLLSRKSPLPHPAYIHVYKLRDWVIPYSTAMQPDRCVAQLRGWNSRNADVDGFAFHVHAVASDPRRCVAEGFIALRCSISAYNINLGSRTAKRHSEIIQQIEKTGIEFANVVGPVITEEIVEFTDCFRKIVIAFPINKIEPFTCVQVIEHQTVFSIRGRLQGRRCMGTAPKKQQELEDPNPANHSLSNPNPAEHCISLLPRAAVAITCCQQTTAHGFAVDENTRVVQAGPNIGSDRREEA